MSEAYGGAYGMLTGFCEKCGRAHHQDYAYCDGRRRGQDSGPCPGCGEIVDAGYELREHRRLHRLGGEQGE